ncbi:MAG: hypothetical protein HYY13_13260 [Nitrospirae bacterium]|nr:hypothetical protein [Nitrospirota bacterium]
MKPTSLVIPSLRATVRASVLLVSTLPIALGCGGEAAGGPASDPPASAAGSAPTLFDQDVARAAAEAVELQYEACGDFGCWVGALLDDARMGERYSKAPEGVPRPGRPVEQRQAQKPACPVVTNASDYASGKVDVTLEGNGCSYTFGAGNITILGSYRASGTTSSSSCDVSVTYTDFGLSIRGGPLGGTSFAVSGTAKVTGSSDGGSYNIGIARDLDATLGDGEPKPLYEGTVTISKTNGAAGTTAQVSATVDGALYEYLAGFSVESPAKLPASQAVSLSGTIAVSATAPEVRVSSDFTVSGDASGSFGFAGTDVIYNLSTCAKEPLSGTQAISYTPTQGPSVSAVILYDGAYSCTGCAQISVEGGNYEDLCY